MSGHKPKSARAAVTRDPLPPISFDAADRRLVLERLDVDPWRVPDDGLLEYDYVHDEWRIELYTGPGASGPLSRAIIRKHAGRRQLVATRPQDWSPKGASPYARGGAIPAGSVQYTVQHCPGVAPSPEVVRMFAQMGTKLSDAMRARRG